MGKLKEKIKKMLHIKLRNSEAPLPDIVKPNTSEPVKVPALKSPVEVSPPKSPVEVPSNPNLNPLPRDITRSTFDSGDSRELPRDTTTSTFGSGPRVAGGLVPSEDHTGSSRILGAIIDAITNDNE